MAAKVRFGLLVAMFQAMSGDKGSAKKRGRLRVFLDRAYVPSGGRDDFFSALRLVLPGLDRERGTYGLKEAALAAVLVDALGIAKDSPDAVRLINWRRGGGGRNAGNFALVAAEVLQRRQGITSGGLTIKEVNDALDRLAATENRSEKASILSSLIKKTNALEMKWLLMIILKDLKLGISEKSIFDEFHPDAQDLFNVTCDLKFVCEKLKDRSQRHKRQDIEIGKAVRPQLAMRVRDASAAWKKLHGKQVVAECKFDGDRIQIHKNGEEIHFFSRSFLDHSEYAPGMSKIIKENILVDRCILDGEMLVWDTALNRFAEFGSNQEIAKAAREGLETDRQLCYVAFDILYAGDTSVIHQSLTERQEILQKVVKPLKGRLEILIPTGGLNARRPSDEPCWSIIAHNLEDVEKFFKDTIENRDEGIILKDLDSKWEPGDRNGKWLKLKPDYIHAGADLDAIIIGGYYGSGRRGGEVAQFLVGLAVPSDDNSYPKRFLSFCRVGTGLSDEERDALVTKLKPYFRKNEYPKKPPKFYEVTNNSKERPDVWIESPDKSVIMSITSDIRTIKSEVFAAPYCLRFPRIQRLRYDKPWHECLDVQAFVDIVHSSNGTTQRVADDNSLENDNMKRSRTTKKGEKKKSVSIIPSHLMKTDVSGLKGETLIFANMIFYFVNIPSSYNLEYFHKLVVENGGSFSMNLNDSVTHCIAAEKKGIKYQAAIRQGRIIHYDWILDCCKEKRPLHLQPKYILYLADFARHKFPEEIDSYADYYYWDIDIADLKQIFSNIDKVAGDSNMVNQYKRKHCIDERFCFFQGCCVYLHNAPLVNVDYNLISDIALKRVKQDLTMHGGQVCSSIAAATHLVVVSVLQNYNFDILYKSFPPAERRYLHDKRLHVVSNKWLEDSVEKQMKLSETAYNLKPDTLEELEIERSEENIRPLDHKFEEHREVERAHVKHAPRKRSRAASISRVTKAVPRPARRMRARRGNQQAKIDDDVESEESAPGECQDDQNMDTDYNSKEIGKGISNKDQGPPRAAFRPVPRTRARREYQQANIDDGGSEESGPSGTDKEDQKLDVDYISKTVGDNSDKDLHGPPPGAQFVTLGEQEPKGVESNAMEEKPGSPFQRTSAAEVTSSVPGEKIEQMVDPLHAMLLDMIPTLSQTRTEGASRVPPPTIVEKAPPGVGSNTSKSSDILVPDAGTSGVPAPDPNAAPPPKKKKVSYKDVASELLKDW
ncbi:putative DNA ligase 4 [Setaria italica]|uniref:putative DNA ligase 4 n=1 Tax=Setaria italica TaxID=4555 RepID=UPI0007199D38|nr:putative DNA ligase 4 [Setaria italica]XP_022684333.1 putative DNA ligase 4 [Setaria italica]XP_022684334.1 putative DNA ligase 4 [Setaria italica]